jgi:hypothetical protein
MCPACDGWAVETGTAATGRMRVWFGLTVAGAVLLMVGVITILVGEALRVKSPHGWEGTVGLGEIVAASGLGCGLALLAGVAAGRPGGRRAAARSRSVSRRRSVSTSRSASRSVPAGGPVARPSPGTAIRPGPTTRPGRSDRPQQQSPPEYTWDGGGQDAWRRDSAEDWLSPLRNPGAARTPEPFRWSGQPIQEFSPALDYADDGWRTGSVAGPAADSRPPGPPQPRGGAHRATGSPGPQASYESIPQPRYPTDPRPGDHTDRESGQEIAPSSLPAGPAAGADEAADTAPLTVIMASRSLPVPPAPAQAKLDQIKDLYLTAEAIGEDALVRHFEEVSSRQRDLIRQYFEQSGLGTGPGPGFPGDHPAQN